MLQHWSAARATANHAAECEKLARVLGQGQHHLDPGIKFKRRIPARISRSRDNGVGLIFTVQEEVRRLLDIARSPIRLHAHRCGLISSDTTLV